MKLISDESRCFSPRCRSIIYEEGNDKAALFIHGFPTTPHMYAYPAKVFSENGYDVFAPLIPTFGSDYKEFEKSNFSQWFAYIDEYYQDEHICFDYKIKKGVSQSSNGQFLLKQVGILDK